MTMQPLRGSKNFIWNTQDVLGKGATGNVYKARNKKTGELCAVKTFTSTGHHRPKEIQMREFEVQRKLSHENIVQFLACEEESSSGDMVLVMELCAEGSLYTILEQPENAFGLPEKEFLKVLHDVASGMKHLRDNQIIHRDIKPGNIMRYSHPDGRFIYKLIDFGAAKELEDDENFMSLYGTEEYLHPDMYERAVLRRPTRKEYGVFVDLWSLGVTFYQCATGVLPFRPIGGRNNRETMYRITTEKESGVISGVQREDDNQIEWSRELPTHCHLSRGAKTLCVPLLSQLMEIDEQKMMTFDQFFLYIENFLAMRVVHVFDLTSCEILHVFLRKDARRPKFEDEVAKQTEIHTKDHLYMFENLRLDYWVDANQEVRAFPQTTRENPIFLYNKNFSLSVKQLSGFKLLKDLNLPMAKPKPQSLHVGEDYSWGKEITGIVFYMQRFVEKTIHKQLLVQKAAKMFLLVLKIDIEQLRNFAVFFRSCMEEMEKRMERFIFTHRSHERLISIVKNATEESPSMTDWMALEDLIEKDKGPLMQVLQTVKNIQSHIEDFNERVLVKRELCSPWLTPRGCGEADNCQAKLDMAAKNSKQILDEFKKNKLMKRLSYNEEQIHKFEKHKLHKTCQRAHTILTQHCYPQLEEIVHLFEDWFRKANDMRRQVRQEDVALSQIKEKQENLSSVLDETQKSYQLRIDEMIANLHSPAYNTLTVPGSGRGSRNPSITDDSEPRSLVAEPNEKDSGKLCVSGAKQGLQKRQQQKKTIRELIDKIKVMKETAEQNSHLIQQNYNSWVHMQNIAENVPSLPPPSPLPHSPLPPPPPIDPAGLVPSQSGGYITTNGINQ